MTANLKDRIIRHIEMSGPLPVAEYMHWCLFDSANGYYTTKNPIGRSGDFITAPEISQMFGELIGIWLIQAWKSLGMPNKFNLVEIGPGNGTLMGDIIRACEISPEFLQAAEIHMVETSNNLADKQRTALKAVRQIQWHTDITEIPAAPTLVIANEFLDALPFRQYVKTHSGWHERCVITDNEQELAWGLGAGKLEGAALPKSHSEEPEGSVFEISPMRESVVEGIARLISEQEGGALLIDYGHKTSGFGDTFQAISGHQFSDPLSKPGQSDLTSHVDFEPLQKIVSDTGCNVMKILTQGEFLLQLGLLERAGNLGNGRSEEEQQRITREAERLALPDQMGGLFKVMSFSSGPTFWPFDNVS